MQVAVAVGSFPLTYSVSHLKVEMPHFKSFFISDAM